MSPAVTFALILKKGGGMPLIVSLSGIVTYKKMPKNGQGFSNYYETTSMERQANGKGN